MGNFGANGYLDSNFDIGANGTTLYLAIALRAHKNPGAPSNYYGLEMHRDGINDSARIFQVSTDGTPNTRLNLRVNSAGDGVDSGAGALNDSVQYWVLKFAFGAADADTVSFFYNPTLNAAEGMATSSITGTNLSFDRLSVANFGGNFIDFDDIRVGTEYADVVGAVPESSSVAMLLGGMGLFLARRKR